jgi:DNA-3-methyladenine glycosylase II
MELQLEKKLKNGEAEKVLVAELEHLKNLDLARAELSARDPVMRGLIDDKPDLDYDAWRRTLPVEGVFQALLFQIVGQQISVSAANAIYARVRSLFPDEQPEPERLMQISIDELRRIGLSTRKAEYFKDLAQRAFQGELEGMENLSHEEARNKLVTFRGIGHWTADGALLIAFGLPDVLVAGDLVLRKAIQRAYELPEMPTPKEVEALGERWRPHRSVAAGYLFELMISK